MHKHSQKCNRKKSVHFLLKSLTPCNETFCTVLQVLHLSECNIALVLKGGKLQEQVNVADLSAQELQCSIPMVCFRS